MEANGLMIGDWVYYSHTEDGIAPYKEVICIKAEDLCCDACIIETHYEPISLTPEILEKNGFENDFYEEESIADYHTIRLEGYSLKHNIGEIDGYLVTWCNGRINITTDFNGCLQKDISYIHQLQHALRLCGIDKEIVL